MYRNNRNTQIYSHTRATLAQPWYVEKIRRYVNGSFTCSPKSKVQSPKSKVQSPSPIAPSSSDGSCKQRKQSKSAGWRGTPKRTLQIQSHPRTPRPAHHTHHTPRTPHMLAHSRYKIHGNNRHTQTCAPPRATLAPLSRHHGTQKNGDALAT